MSSAVRREVIRFFGFFTTLAGAITYEISQSPSMARARAHARIFRKAP